MNDAYQNVLWRCNQYTVLVENEIDKLFLYSTRRLYTTDDADIGVAS